MRWLKPAAAFSPDLRTSRGRLGSEALAAQLQRAQRIVALYIVLGVVFAVEARSVRAGVRCQAAAWWRVAERAQVWQRWVKVGRGACCCSQRVGFPRGA